MFCLYVILTISYLRAQTIETSSLPTNSSRPLFKQIEIFFYIDCMTVYFNCKYFPWYTRQLLGCLLRISPSGRNPCRGNDPSLSGSGSCFWLVESNFPRGMTNQKHYPGLDSDASSVWNFCACFSDETSFRGETSGGVPKCPLRLDVINLDYQPLFEKWAPLWMVVSRSI